MIYYIIAKDEGDACREATKQIVSGIISDSEHEVVKYFTKWKEFYPGFHVYAVTFTATATLVAEEDVTYVVAENRG